jgi:hypothetical protein
MTKQRGPDWVHHQPGNALHRHAIPAQRPDEPDYAYRERMNRIAYEREDTSVAWDVADAFFDISDIW